MYLEDGYDLGGRQSAQSSARVVEARAKIT